MTANPRQISCGVLVTNGHLLLLGHASRSPRWDVPKGFAEPGEALLDAAVRELKEETSLSAPSTKLRCLGTHAYLRNKNLALFVWRLAEMPAPESLVCTSMVNRLGSPSFPELDRFGIFPFESAVAMVGRNLALLLTKLQKEIAG